MQYFKIKAKSLALSYVLIALFQIHSGGTQRQNYPKSVAVQILMHLAFVQ